MEAVASYTGAVTGILSLAGVLYAFAFRLETWVAGLPTTD